MTPFHPAAIEETRLGHAGRTLGVAEQFVRDGARRSCDITDRDEGPEAYAPVWMVRGEGGALSEVSLEQVERGSVGKRELEAHAILVIANQTGETAMKFWRAQCVAAGLITRGTEDAQEKAMNRIRSALVAAGLVTKGKVRGLWVPA